jgi:hypothetical protein
MRLAGADDLLQEKLLTWLESHSTITEKAPAPADGDASETKGETKAKPKAKAKKADA